MFEYLSLNKKYWSTYLDTKARRIAPECLCLHDHHTFATRRRFFWTWWSYYAIKNLDRRNDNAVRSGRKSQTIVCSGSYMGIVIYLVCAAGCTIGPSASWWEIEVRG